MNLIPWIPWFICAGMFLYYTYRHNTRKMIFWYVGTVAMFFVGMLLTN